MKNKFRYTIGNKKIARDTLIFNMGPSEYCPSKARGLCQLCDPEKCYARKAERQYKQVLPYRRAQAAYWRRNSAGRIGQDIYNVLLRHKKIKYIRVNESGDFYNQSDIKRMYIISGMNKKVIFYLYTARRDLNFSGPQPENLVLNGSRYMLNNEFKAVDNMPAGAFECKGNCRECDLCKVRLGITIYVKNH